MSYQVATANGRVGHASVPSELKINLGTQKGYSGSVQDKQEVLDFITTIHEQALMQAANFITFVVTDSVLVYGSDEGERPTEDCA